MNATLLGDYSSADETKLESGFEKLRHLPAEMRERWNRLLFDAAMNNRIEDLHRDRNELQRRYDVHLRGIEWHRSLAESLGSDLVGELDRLAAELSAQREDLFGRWNSLDDLCRLAIQAIQPSPERLRAIAIKNPPPQKWLDETIDPFTAE